MGTFWAYAEYSTELQMSLGLQVTLVQISLWAARQLAEKAG